MTSSPDRAATSNALSDPGSSAHLSWPGRAFCAFLVAAAYYLGAQLGFALQSPNAPQSVLWLPNSILLGVLLITPVREWPLYIVAAFPAQMMMAWEAGAPPVTLALLFVTNCADAALGAYVVRAVARSAGPFRFDTLRNTVIFAVGAAAATILMSFADAGISVATSWSGDFAAALSTRIRSNVLTHLIVVPAIVDLAALQWRRVRTSSLVEASILTAALVGTWMFAFAKPTASQGVPAFLYMPLPLLLWAAVRFGPGATGWAALLVSTVASWNALQGRGPFASHTPLEGVVSLQLFLLATAIPLLFLAAVIRERNRATRALQANETALRNSAERARELAGKLISAQETERARIARDMHDDFNQQLAALSISISGMRRVPAQGAEIDYSLRTLQERVVGLTEQVRQLSHDLHPGVLEHLGLAPALRRHCLQVAEQQQQLHLDFAADPDLGEIPRDVAICLYRIVQEGLRNVVNHASASRARVVLSRATDRVVLTITDGGRGFDPSTTLARGGLGLMSIEERARLVGGTLTVTSARGRGTTLHVQVPLAATPHANAAAGHA